MSPIDKPLIWFRTRIATPPLSSDARVRAGHMLRRLQKGEFLAMPESRPMPSFGMGCHELRIPDGDVEWRIAYRIDSDAIAVFDVFRKTTMRTPKRVIDRVRARIKRYDEACSAEDDE